MRQWEKPLQSAGRRMLPRKQVACHCTYFLEELHLTYGGITEVDILEGSIGAVGRCVKFLQLHCMIWFTPK
jgi:hypothetical protein